MLIKQIGFSICILLFSSVLKAQYSFFERNYLEPQSDTILIDERSGTSHIDSLDRAYYNLQPSLFNNGRGYLPEYRSLKDWGTYRHFFADERSFYKADYHFTGLPYMGFFYSFGAGGDQVMDVRYTQNHGQNLNFSFRYHRSSDNGLMRRSATNMNELNFKVAYKGKRFRSYLDAYYAFDEYDESGGLIEDENTALLPLELIGVERLSASANVKRGYVVSKNYVSIGKDSLSPWSIYFSPSFHFYGRRFTELDVDTLIFPTANISKTETNDYWQEPHLLADAGVHFSRKDIEVTAGYVIDFWQFSNHANRFTGVDNYLVSGLKAVRGKFTLSNTARLFVSGNPFEFYEQANLNYRFSEKTSIGGEILVENYFIEPFQMRYSANHYDWTNVYANSEPTTRFFKQIYIDYKGKQKIRLEARQISIVNQSIFQDSNWVGSGVTQHVFSPRVWSELRLGKFVCQTNAELFLSNQSVIRHPDYRLRSRILFDSPVFKAKRLLMATGFEINYIPRYEVAAYLPELGIYQFNGAGMNYAVNLVQLDYFLNIQIERFRFLISVNGINNLFDTTPRYSVQNYHVRPFFVRLGFSWDFVN
jgi:hypothetical protein